jgi:acylphosphatase
MKYRNGAKIDEQLITYKRQTIMKTVLLLIKGKVQGVFYRATAKDMAEKIGVKGWIKNTEEGNVEALISGTEAQLEAFIQWCWQGPSRAKVTDVIMTERAVEALEDFTIIRG